MPCHSTPQAPIAGNQNVQRTQAAQNPLPGERRCFACGEKGHFANKCPNLRNRPPLAAVSTPAPTHGANFVPVAARQNFIHGKVNHVTVEEGQEAPDVVIGTFSINDLSAVVLFDSGASHSFVSTAYVEKHNLPMALLRSQMIVSSPKEICPQGSYARR
jgi:hypothetical protein